jgi:hypothetical protein
MSCNSVTDTNFWFNSGLVLMMEAASSSEPSANIYQTTQRNISEDGHLHTRRRENLKSYLTQN